MTSTLFRDARIVAPTGITSGKLLTEDGAVSQVRSGRSIDAPVNRITGTSRCYLSLGPIDIHTRDVGDVDFMNGVLNTIYQACRKCMEYGTAPIVFTIITSTKGSLPLFVDLLGQVQLDREDIPDTLSLYLEGPYFVYERYGA